MSDSIEVRRARLLLEVLTEEQEIREAFPVCDVDACDRQSSVYDLCAVHASMSRIDDPKRWK